MQKAMFACAIALSLTGCDMSPAPLPEITQCEARTTIGLASPSSYKRIEANVSDSQLLNEALFRRYTGIDPRVSVPKQARLRIVYLEYDASNSYGAVLRDTELCYFAITDQQHTSATPVPMEIPLTRPEPVVPGDPSTVVFPAQASCCLDDPLVQLNEKAKRKGMR